MHYDYAEETHKWVLDAFEEIGIHKFDDTNDGLIRFSMLVPKSKFRAYDFAIRLCDHTLTMYMIAPFRGDDSDRKMMTKLAVLQTNANYGLRNGNFEMDLRDGEIRYKTYINLENSTVNPDVLDDAIHMSIAAFDVYGKDMAKIVYGFGQESEDEELDDEKDETESVAVHSDSPIRRLRAKIIEALEMQPTENFFEHLYQLFGGESPEGETADPETVIDLVAETLDLPPTKILETIMDTLREFSGE
ncbi:MAG: hypothetical protein ACLUYS_00040 [Allobaculum sp.]|uniref:hypothetical protein n=1 Tax=Allobaculum sp. TaxID=1872463 RepID=UPI00399A009D